MSNRVRIKPAVKPRNIDLMLDSGAFSAWQSGTEVDMKAYMKWLKAHKQWLFSYVTLDVLPGGPAKVDSEQAAAGSDRNLQIMLDAGLEPIPVFHQFERFKWLVKLLKDGHPYIGISSNPTRPLRERMDWLNQVFTILCDSKGRPCVKTHGFAMGAPELVYTYPFYTVDSTTWILGGAAYGRIVLPKVEGDASETADMYVGRVGRGDQHIDNAFLQKDGALERFADAGVTEQEVRNSFIARAKVMSLVTKRLVAARTRATPCLFKQWTRTWEMDRLPQLPELKAIKPFDIKVFNVAWGNVMNHVLNEIDQNDRLMSYLQIRKWDEDRLARYVATGFPTAYKYKGKN